MPAIQQEIATVFARDGVRQEDADDPDLARYINKLIGDRQQCGDNLVGEYSSLGRGVGSQRDFDDRSQDVFELLMPNKNMY